MKLNKLMIKDITYINQEIVSKSDINTEFYNGNDVYIETYGCQMNVNDSEIVSGILVQHGYRIVDDISKSNIVLLNTCSVRDNAEAKIMHRLAHLKAYRKQNKKLIVGILGCMAERLKGKLIGKQDLVSIVIGPDEYRKVPELIEQAQNGESGIAVKLSKVETYSDIIPLRTEGFSAWVSIMRGCDKFCTYCIVPFTRGNERSKPFPIIINEVIDLQKQGIKEVTLLGQNVNSYVDLVNKADFAKLLDEVAKAVPEMRIRYTTSHPYDMTDELIEVMANHQNICKYIHLPVQSGSERILKLMNRHYTPEYYLERIEKIRFMMPYISLSTDIISGFPTENEEDHQQTLYLMEQVRFDGAYMFNYSPREKTKAYKWTDDVSDETKKRRLNEIIDLQNKISKENNKNEIGRIHEVLVEGASKKNKFQWQGRSDTNKVVIFDNANLKYQAGNIVKCKIKDSTSATLFGDVID